MSSALVNCILIDINTYSPNLRQTAHVYTIFFVWEDLCPDRTFFSVHLTDRYYFKTVNNT